MPARILVIALDSYDKDLLLRWAGSGELPALGALLQRATWGVVEGPAALYGGTVWPSFFTGTYPGYHRRFFRRQARRGEYLDVEVTPHDIQGIPFWQTLSDAGQTVAVFDVPHSRLASSLNGVQVVDWASHDPELEQAQTYPATLREEVITRFGVEPRDWCEEVAQTAEGYRALYAHLEARLRSKMALTLHYLDSSDWDFFITAFGEAHCAGHQWWHLHDVTHPRHDPAVAAATGDLLKAMYVAMDRAVGEVVAGVGPQTHLIVLCSHGMGPLYGESVAIDAVLRRLEPSGVASGSLFGALKRGWYGLPAGVRAWPLLRGLRRRLQRPLQESLLVPDRRRRRFFTIPHNPHGAAIRINLAGRETHGIVQPGEEYHQLCTELRQELLALRCPETGAEIVAEVFTIADLYDGPFADELPDLVVEWSRRKPVRAMSSPRVGTVAIPTIPGRTGDHKRLGLFLATGPALRPERIERCVSIVDFAPTFAALLGVTPPPAWAGRPIAEVLPASA